MTKLSGEQAEESLSKLHSGWEIKEGKLEKVFQFKNFAESMEFVNQVAKIAEANDHHPEIEISYSKVDIELSTHSVGGLSEKDFVLAAKIDELGK